MPAALVVSILAGLFMTEPIQLPNRRPLGNYARAEIANGVVNS